MRTSSIAAVLAVGLGSATTHAESRAWTAGKTVLPANLQLVLGANLVNLHGSTTFQTLEPMVLAQAGGAKDALDAIQKDCGIDVLGALDSAVVGVDADQKATVVIALKRVTRAELEACAQKRAKAQNQTLAITTTSGVTKYGGLAGKDVYIRWLNSTTVAFTTDVSDSAQLTKLTAGGIAKDKSFTKQLAAVRTDAGVWSVIHRTDTLPDPVKAQMTAAYGSATFAGDKLDVNLHVVLGNAKAATDAAAAIAGKLAELDKAKQIPGDFDKLVKATKFAATGAELVVTTSIAEGELMQLFGTVVGSAMSH